MRTCVRTCVSAADFVERLTPPSLLWSPVHQAHTSCVTEHAKYALGATKPGGQGAAASAGSNRQGAAGLYFLAQSPPWTCRCCNVTCTSRETLEGHAAGQKHVKRSRAAAAAAAAGAVEDGGAPAGSAPVVQTAAVVASDSGKRKRGDGGEENGVKWKKLVRAELASAAGGRMKTQLLVKGAVAAARRKLGDALTGVTDEELHAQCETRLLNCNSRHFVVTEDGYVCRAHT